MGDPFNCSCSTTVAVHEIAVIVALNLTTPLLCGQWVSPFPWSPFSQYRKGYTWSNGHIRDDRCGKEYRLETCVEWPEHTG